MKHTPTPWRKGYRGADIGCENEKVGGVAKLLDVRGWGYLTGTGHGALGLSAEEAAAAQTEFTDFVVTAVNAYDKHRALIETLVKALEEAQACLEGEPEYHHSGMGCGLEDRNIQDRYEAMEHGWERAMERVYGEHINDAREVISAALAAAGGRQRQAPRYVMETVVEALERIVSVCSDRSDKSNWHLDYISDKAQTALAAAKEQSQ